MGFFANRFRAARSRQRERAEALGDLDPAVALNVVLCGIPLTPSVAKALTAYPDSGESRDAGELEIAAPIPLI